MYNLTRSTVTEGDAIGRSAKRPSSIRDKAFPDRAQSTPKAHRGIATFFSLALTILIVAAAMPELPRTSANDADVAHVLNTAGELNILQANLAIQKTENENVRAYATALISGSQVVLDSVAAFAASMSIVPSENKWSDSLEALSDATAATLDELTGSAFDAQFAAEQVTYQKSLANLIESELIDVTQSSRLLDSANKLHKHALDMSDRATALQAMIEM